MKRKLTTHYSLMDQLMASPTEPLSKAKQEAYMNKVWASYCVLRGSSPDYESVDRCIDIINMVESLIALGIAEDRSGLIPDAQRALGRCVESYPDGPAQALTPEGADAVRAVLEDYAEAMAQLPARTMIQCHRRAEWVNEQASKRSKRKP
jgi:hypothetical protein